MKRLTYHRFMLSFVLALVLGLAGWVLGAKAEPHTAQFNLTPDCQNCHNVLRESWEMSAHGRSTTDEVFLAAWTEAGEPGECLSCHTTGYDPATGETVFDAVACITCHRPVNESHPNEVMPTNIDSRMCGECHLDTFAQWETSLHAKEELACVRCHNSHTTDLKAHDVQELCQNCHSDTVHSFGYTAHAEEGLLCIDCHLQVSDTEMGDGHGRREHTFEVELDTCAECHSESMHSAPAMTTENQEEMVQAGVVPPVDENLQTEPADVSPVGFGILGTLVGVAFGMLLAPWLDRWYKKVRLD